MPGKNEGDLVARRDGLQKHIEGVQKVFQRRIDHSRDLKPQVGFEHFCIAIRVAHGFLKVCQLLIITNANDEGALFRVRNRRAKKCQRQNYENRAYHRPSQRSQAL